MDATLIFQDRMDLCGNAEGYAYNTMAEKKVWGVTFSNNKLGIH